MVRGHNVRIDKQVEHEINTERSRDESRRDDTSSVGDNKK